MTYKPEYSTQADQLLTQIECGSDLLLLRAVTDAIELIVNHGTQAKARRRLFTSTSGIKAYAVPIPDSRYEWVVLWWPNGEVANISYIGPL